jgi:protoheme IX farnesyltransferase
MVREYYRLMKPGIIYGNALTAVAGFGIATESLISPTLLFMVFGLSCIVASGCIFNNYLDRDIDGKMERTKDRALVQGTISEHAAIVFGILMGVSGSVLLYFTNVLTLIVALFGLFSYVVLYTILVKRSTVHGTLLGSISGAIPPVVGYTAATNSLDVGALILFLILVSWQMPHALAIAIRRIEDYRRANIPIMPISRGLRAAQAQMFSYVFIFLCANFTLWFKGFTGSTYVLGMTFVSLVWLYVCFEGFFATDEKAWAKKVFLFSLVIICVFCLLSLLNGVLP